MIQNKIQIDEKDLEFIKKAYKTLSYKSLSHYMREAIQDKVHEDRKKLKALQRSIAMEQIGGEVYKNLFEGIEGEDFEDRRSTVFKSEPSATRGSWTGWVRSRRLN